VVGNDDQKRRYWSRSAVTGGSILLWGVGVMATEPSVWAQTVPIPWPALVGTAMLWHGEMARVTKKLIPGYKVPEGDNNG